MLRLERQRLHRSLLHASSDGQQGVADQELVHLARALATLVNTPDNQGLSTTGITRRKDVAYTGLVAALGRLDVGPSVELDAHRLEQLSLGAHETHRQEHQIRLEVLLRAGHLLHRPAAGGVLGPLDADGVEALDLAVAIRDKLLGHD